MSILRVWLKLITILDSKVMRDPIMDVISGVNSADRGMDSMTGLWNHVSVGRLGLPAKGGQNHE